MKAPALLLCLLVALGLLTAAGLADNAPSLTCPAPAWAPTVDFSQPGQLTALTLPAAHFTQSVDEFYMRLQYLPGPALWSRHTDWFPVLYFQPQVALPKIVDGKFVYGTLYLTKKVDEFSAAFTLALGGHWHQPWAKIKFYHCGKCVMTVQLDDVWISDLKLGGPDQVVEPTGLETLGIAFAGCTVTQGGSDRRD